MKLKIFINLFLTAKILKARVKFQTNRLFYTLTVLVRWKSGYLRVKWKKIFVYELSLEVFISYVNSNPLFNKE